MKNKKNKKLRGRTKSTWKVALLGVLTTLIVLVGALGALLALNGINPIELIESIIDTQTPDSGNEGMHIAIQDDENIFGLQYSRYVRKYSMVEALKRFNNKLQIKSAMKPSNESKGNIYNFLVLGKDHVGMNTDVMMIVNYDVDNNAISILQIPRDTYVKCDVFSGKINSTFYYMYNKAKRDGEKDLYDAALKSTAELFEKSLNIEINSYALVNLNAFTKIVDIIGGVGITVPDDMHYDDPAQGLSIHIYKGYQVLNGETAAKFIRFRSGYLQADIGRQNAQKLFMTAFIKQFKQSISIDKVARIAEQAIKNVTTDISINDTVYFAKQLLNVDLSSVNMMTMPGTAVNLPQGSYYVINRADTLEVINKYFNVYKNDIPDELFDQNSIFTNKSASGIHSVYMSENGDYTVNNAEGLDNDGIYIPRVNYYPPSQSSPSYTNSSGNTNTDSEDTNEADTSDAADTEDGEASDSTENSEITDTDGIDTQESADTTFDETAENPIESSFITEEENTEEETTELDTYIE